MTKVEALELLKNQTKKPGKENYVYREDHVECVYFDHDGPSCIVGHVLADLGYENRWDISGSFCDEAGFFQDLRFDQGAVSLLTRAQLWQDGTNATWEQAVEAASRGWPRNIHSSVRMQEKSAACVKWMDENGIEYI